MKPQISPQSLTPLTFLPIVQPKRGEAAIKSKIQIFQYSKQINTPKYQVLVIRILEI
jgi:hypothetical protein